MHRTGRGNKLFCQSPKHNIINMNYTADIAPINKTFLKSVDEILRNYV